MKTSCAASAVLPKIGPNLRIIALFFAIALVFGVRVGAQVPDLTNGEVRLNDNFWNLGPTGMTGWFYFSGSSTDLARQIEVTVVDAGSPADGILAVGDVILGADGTGAEPVAFSSDARKALAYAIADAEANDPAILKLLRWRAGSTTTVSVTLEYLGAYSATAPYNCPKSAAILEKGLDAVMASGASDAWNFSLIALLAGNDPANPDNAARQARAQQEAHSLILPQAEIDRYTSGISLPDNKIAWNLGFKLVAIAEYYLQTGDPAVYESMRAYAIAYANGQSMFGTGGHQFAKMGPNGEVNGPYGKGYGVINSANMQCFYGALLAREAGVNDQEVLDAIERASRYYGSFVDRGTIPYGENQPAGGNESNGKMGIAALCFKLEGDHVYEAKYFARTAGASGRNRDVGHTGPYLNYLWSSLGANVGGEDTMATFFAAQSWHYDLSRNWDGSFTYNTYGGGAAGTGTEGWSTVNLQMYVTTLLAYATPLRQTYTTGKVYDPQNWHSTTELNEIQLATFYDPTTRTTNELLGDIALSIPAPRRGAAVEIGLRTSEHASLLPILHSMALDTNATVVSRMGACHALGEIGDDSSVPIIVDLVDDPESRIRWAAAGELRRFSKEAKLEHIHTLLAACISTSRPLLPLDEADPLHLDHANLTFALFGSGAGGTPYGILREHGLVGIDRDLLLPAIRASLRHPMGNARSAPAATMYSQLTKEEIQAVAGALVESTIAESPADRMASSGVRAEGLFALQTHNFSEGVPLAKIVFDDKRDPWNALKALEDYAASSLSVKPDPHVVDFCKLLIAKDDDATRAQWVLDAIEADLNPEELQPLKGIHYLKADQPSLTLPQDRTTIRAFAYDHVGSESIYTWRKVHGAGDVTFTENGSPSAQATTVIFDGTPGKYLFEVTVSDALNLTEVTGTVAVTLNDIGGTLPPNNAPSADSQSITVEQGAPIQVLLSGTDPEGFALTYSVTDGPDHGLLSGEAPSLVYTPPADYSGPDSITFEVMDSEGLVSTATVSITVNSASPVGLAIYEPFDYPAGALDGASGGTEIGLAGSWVAGNALYTEAPSLTYDILPSAGLRVRKDFNSGDGAASRSISAEALANRGLLDDGATVWFSAIMGNSYIAYLQSVRIAFANGKIGNNYIEDDGGVPGTGLGMVLSGGTVTATQFYDVNGAAPLQGDWTFDAGGTMYLDDTQRLVVGKVTWGASSDTIEIYIPYNGMVLPSNPSSTLVADVDQSKFDVLTFSCNANNNSTAVIDEIRVGATLQSVIQGTVNMTTDTQAPAPDPMGFAVAPVASGGSSITMEATTAYDPMGVEYYFTCTAGGGNDSGWQDSHVYTDSGLTPGVSYSYTVKARDKHPGLNETANSPAASATIPVQGTVPDVEGIVQAVAEGLIVDAGMTVGSVTNAVTYSQTVPAGHVLSQSPSGPLTTAYGTSVDLVISIGQDPNLPTLASVDIVDDQGGIETILPSMITYTLTFSEDMDISTIDAGDFVNLESYPVIIGAINEVSPGVVTVEVIPDDIDSGYLLFAIAQGAVIKDAQGDDLNTSSAIADEQSIALVRPDNYLPVVDAGPDQTVTLSGAGGSSSSVSGAYYEWDASADTPGDALWQSTTANSYDWGFDAGNLSPVSLSPSRFEAVTMAYEFPAARDTSSPSFESTGATGQPATFELVLDVDGPDGSIFETGGSGDGMQIDIVGGVLRGTVQESTPARATYTLTPSDYTRLMHVVFVADQVNDVVQLYVDDVLVDSQPWTSGEDWAGTDNASLGADAATIPTGGSTDDFIGKIGLFRFYNNKAFTAAEVSQNFDSLNSGGTTTAIMAGTASDIDAGDTVITTWTTDSGPLAAEFADVQALDSIATFNAAGTYVLRLTADDGTDQVYDQVTITVNPGGGGDTTPPTLAASDIVDDQGGANVNANDVVTYTLTFSEDMNAATVDASDFSNAGSSAVNIGSITETSPGVFTVEATPLDAGSLQLQVSAGASLQDAAGNPLDTASAIIDDTTITVDGAANNAPVWAANPVNETAATENVAYSSTLADDASDANSDPLTFAKVSGPAWLSVAANGDLSGTPGNGDVGANSFTVSVTDGIIATPVEATLNISVLQGTDTTPPNPDPMTWAIAPAPVTAAGAPVQLASTDFTGRIVTGATASNITWTVNGITDPGDLTTDAPDGLFDTANVQGFFAPDRNVDNEGPWSVSVPMNLTAPTLYLTEIVIDYRHFKNDGTYQTGSSRTVSWTFTVTGSVSGEVGSVMVPGVGSLMGSETATFASPVTLTNSESYTLGITATGGGAGNNTGLDTLTLNGALPGAVSETEITMTATNATDENDVEYYFTETSGNPGGNDSGWQDSPAYIDSGLQSGTQYSYMVTARDKSVNQNATAPSALASATTGGTPQTNSAPVWTTDPVDEVDATEDAAYSATLADDASDANPGDTLTFAKVSGPVWLNVAANGDLSGTPDNNDVGANVFTVSVTDGIIATPVEATLNITVINSNDAPVFTVDPIAGAGATEDLAYAATISGSATDEDAGDSLTYAKVSGPAWLNVAANGDLSGTPSNGDVGPNSFTVSVTDGVIATAVEATLNITVSNTNDAPVWLSNPVSESNATEDVAYSATLADNATDIDAGASLTFAKVNGPAWLSVAANGALSGTPGNSDVGVNVFTVSVSDGIAAAVDATLNITVINTNDAPVFTVDPIAGADATEDAAYAGTLAGSATDEDAGDTLTYAKVSGPAWLAVAANGGLSGTPNNDDVGANAFMVSVTDGNSPAVNATLNITVINTNDAPVFAADPIGGSDATEDSAYAGSLTGTATDEDAGDTLTYGKVSGPAWLSVAANGDLTGTPANDDVGSNAFTVSATDGNSPAVNATLNIMVINTNDAPVFTVDPIAGADATEDAAYVGSLAGSATDEDAGDTLTYAKVSGPAWLAVASNGDLSGTPNNDDVGASAFTVSVTDGNSPVVNATLNITVINTNDAPVFTADPIAGADATEDAAYAGTVAGSATDEDAGDILTYAKVSGPAWLAVAANGGLSGTPGSGDVGMNSFTLNVSDGNGGSDTATLEITVNGTADNTAPNPDPMSWAVVPAPASGSGPAVLASTDFTGRTVIGATASNINWTTNGIASPGDLTTDAPDGLFDTADTQGYFAPDRNVDNEGPWSVSVPINPAVATLDLTDVVIDYHHFKNDGVYQSGVNRQVDWTFTVTGSVSGVLDSLTVVGVAGVSGSETAVFAAPITLTNTESYTLDITATGGGAGNNTGLGTLTINGALSAGNSDSEITMTATTATDESGVEYYFTETSGNPGGDDSGWQDSPTYTDTGLQAGTQYTYTVTARDKSANQNTTAPSVAASATTTGTAPNAAPSWAADPVYEADATRGVAYASTLADDASDPEGDTLTFAKLSGPTWLSVASDGALSGTPTSGDVGANSFTVSVSDGINAAVSATLNITVVIPTTTVPDVVGQSQATAESNIVAANLVVGNVTNQYDANVPAGDVISQSPAGGSTVDEGTSVDLVVSLGPPLTSVPDVVGLAQATAESDILAANLAVGTITQEYSATVPAGDIISQGLSAGSSVPEGSTVDLVVSLGVDTSPKLVRTTVSGVTNTSWTTVNLGQTYTSPVVVATPIYPVGETIPVVTRITNVTSSSFDLMIDRADGLTAAVSFDVSVIAVDEGVYTQATDGVTMEAVKYTSTMTSGRYTGDGWTADARTFQNSYTSPAVIGQVMSYNDANWSVFWSLGSSRQNAVDAANLNVGKHVGEDSNTTRADETIGYIVIESGNGTINGVAYEAAMGSKDIRGLGNSATPYSYTLGGGLASVGVAGLSQSGMSGTDGSWAALYGNPAVSNTSINLYCIEDQIRDSEQSHAFEHVSYIVFE